MRRMLANGLSVGFSLLRFLLVKLMHPINFSFYVIERFSPNVVVEISRHGTLRLGRKVRVHSGSKIKVRNGGEITIGENVKVNYNCIFVCRNKISIGAGTEFGPSVCLYDHDHTFDKKTGVNPNQFRTAPISIGKNVWIGAGTIILRGTKIGDNCVVGAGCVLTGEYSPGSLIVQKRETTIQ